MRLRFQARSAWVGGSLRAVCVCACVRERDHSTLKAVKEPLLTGIISLRVVPYHSSNAYSSEINVDDFGIKEPWDVRVLSDE